MNNSQFGLSLVELMLAVALSSVMVLGILQVFSANKQAGSLTSSFARVQENGRMAVEMFARDMRMADGWGCASIGTGDILNHLDKDDADFKPYMDFTGASGLAASDGIAAGTSIDSIEVKEGTDTLTIRGARPLHNVRVVPPYMVVPSAVIHINPGVDIPKGTILIITDCTGADIFTNTHNNTAASGNLIHNTGNITVAGAVNNAIKPLSHTYGANAQILVPYVKVYFIGKNIAGGWSLFRQENGVTSELVRNVRSLQITYGEDTGSDGSADLFSNAGSIGDMDKVVLIRASFVVESDSTINGIPLSKSYRVTTNIRNRSL